MNTEKNKVIIRNLVGRLIRRNTVYELPGGILSGDEVNALKSFTKVFPVSEDGLEEDDSVDVPEIIRTAFDKQGPPEEEIRLCLDFGTAMSKAWASRREDGDTIPLALGQIAGTGDTLVLPSSIYISQSGRIYFGASAETQHRQEIETGRQRFDNLKQMLSEAEVEQELDDVPLSSDIDPTESGLSKGDLLVLYLAWLTDLALKSLENTVDSTAISGSLRYVRRRFAIPCFEHALDETIRGEKRAEWATSVMERALLRAQVVADSLTGNWSDLTVEKVSPLLTECRKINIKKLTHLLAEIAPVREPVAAGASRFNEMIQWDDDVELIRRMLLVVDAGAGTTDFALFQVFQNNIEGEIRYALIPSSVRMCRVAGNDVDSVIGPLALGACNIDLQTRREEEARIINISLHSQLRDIKHELFEKEEARIELRPNASGILKLISVLQDEEYNRRKEELHEVRNEIIQSVFSNQLDDLRTGLGGTPYPIYVLLTGGSASLPIIRDLAKGSTTIEDVSFRFSEVSQFPGWINNSLLREQEDLILHHYSQCAVAIGGSVRELPQEISDLENVIFPPPSGQRHLEAYR